MLCGFPSSLLKQHNQGLFGVESSECIHRCAAIRRLLAIESGAGIGVLVCRQDDLGRHVPVVFVAVPGVHVFSISVCLEAVLCKLKMLSGVC